MGLAQFVARDPRAPGLTLEELEKFLSKMDGVLDWALDENGEVAIEYDQTRINDELIENALSGLGLTLTHLSDNPQGMRPVSNGLSARIGGGPGE